MAEVADFQHAAEVALIQKIQDARGKKELFRFSRQESEMMLDMAVRGHELQRTFDMVWAAEMRGIKRWQKETGKTNTLPDKADFTVWLLKKAFPDQERSDG